MCGESMRPRRSLTYNKYTSPVNRLYRPSQLLPPSSGTALIFRYDFANLPLLFLYFFDLTKKLFVLSEF